MHKVIACVGVYLVVVLEGGGRKLSQQRKHTHGRETWPSIGHVGENPWRLNKHSYLFITSQGHQGYSLRSHKVKPCLYLMLNFFFLPQILPDIWHHVAFTIWYFYYTVKFFIFFNLPDYALCPHYIAQLFSSFFPAKSTCLRNYSIITIIVM